MYIVGLTGGIGSGKTAVASYFKDIGVPVYDTDEIARELVQPGLPAYQEIKSLFGESVVDEYGNLDRRKLRTIVFNNTEDRKKLESILHPRIRESLMEKISQTRYRYCIAVIPLLIETHWQPHVDRILVVDSSEALQKQRASQRDGMAVKDIENIMRSQIDRETRLSQASDVIYNLEDLESLQKQVAQLHEKYLTLAPP